MESASLCTGASGLGRLHEVPQAAVDSPELLALTTSAPS